MHMENLIRENYLVKLRRYYDSNLIKVLTGVRRCGKSILLRQIEEELIRDFHVNPDHVIDVNFEDVTFSNLTTYSKLHTYIMKRIIDKDKYYIFLDETSMFGIIISIQLINSL